MNAKLHCMLVMLMQDCAVTKAHEERQAVMVCEEYEPRQRRSAILREQWTEPLGEAWEYNFERVKAYEDQRGEGILDEIFTGNQSTISR